MSICVVVHGMFCNSIFGHFRQMVNLAIMFKSLANGYNYGTIFKIHACINWNYIEYIIMIA